ncbi:uncharacterized protein F5Z01DRAFT_147570 [Emericellopsis atlantica]|uniref:Uncharacterized protein n=1 Tax=Emericellopsis atlantica TaxID=2614577 RepID=A0A9P8CNJ6_9HYPO|nr:uncharacterized protein F5Z01DRAFT_147570 [Emericellopsis atlantica]KAG9253588.1 hypothetical protein F5Z01DRAFT_147570 [Emericellopsis atlantica]
MATAETVDLGPAHPPKEDSIVAFEHLLPELKSQLARMRRDYQKHETEYFAAAQKLSDDDLTAFQTSDFTSVRVATTAYGIHLFGKIRIPALAESGGPAYIHVRIFIAGGDEPPKLHSIHTEEKDDESGGKTYRAIFTEQDELEWFDT